MSSPPVVPFGGALIDCAITNITSSPATVTLKAVDDDGVVDSILVTVKAQESKSYGGACASGVCTAPRCQFVTSSPASSFRAIACVRDRDASSSSTDKVCVEAR